MRGALAPCLILLIALAAGCSGADSLDTSVEASADEQSQTAVAAAGTDGMPEATVGVASPEDTVGEGSVSSGKEFVDAARVEGGAGFHADTVLGVRYGEHEDYERVVLDLGTGEKPAGTVPRWTLVSPKGDGLLRVYLPSISATGVSDGRLGDGLLRGFHVVRAPDGGMFVDIFARRAFVYRVLEIGDPARLVVDFRPTGAPLAVPLPAAGGGTVLVEPRSRARVSNPLTVSGYSRNFEAANTIILTDSDGKVLVRRTVTGNDWSSTWGYFEATLDLPPFDGRGTLHVGTASARDGSFDGVEIPVRGS